MARSVVLLAVFLGASVLVAVSACRQLADIHARSSEQTVCANCVSDSCGAQSSACAASASCAPRLSCALACDPTLPDASACQANCAASAVADVADLGAVDSCFAKSCASDCAIQCGGVLPLVAPQAAVACAACVASQCCQQASACAASPDCLSGLECARGQSTSDGVQTCTDVKYATGSSAYHALDECVVGDCTDACGVGADWSCVGHVVAPVATQDAIQATLKVVQASSQAVPVPGLDVVGCSVASPDCSDPITPVVVTDTNGDAVLTLPTLGQGGRTAFLGYLRITDPAGVYSTELGFSVPPTSQNDPTEAIIIFSLAEVQAEGSLLPNYGPTNGVAVVTAVDCANQPAPGVTFEVETGDASVPVFYTVDEIVSQSATRTDSSGTAIVGYFSPELPVTVNVRSIGLGQVVATAQLLGRAGAVSLLRVGPTP